MDPSYKQTLSPGAVFVTALTPVPDEVAPADTAASELEAARSQLPEPGQYLL